MQKAKVSMFVAFWQVLLFALPSFAASTDTAPYFPFHAGDQRIGVNSVGALKETVVDLENAGGTLAWRVELTAAGSDETVVYYWRQSLLGPTIVGGIYSNALILFDPPITIPAAVSAGQVISSSGSLVSADFGIPAGSYQATLTITSTTAVADTYVGTFNNCLEILYDITVIVFGNSARTVTKERRATGIGTVWLQTNAEEGSEPLTLLYAQVGDTYLGNPGDFNHDGRIDIADARAIVDMVLPGAGAYDPFMDLAPYHGDIPEIVPQFDGRIDADDLAAFIAIFAHSRSPQ